MLTDQRVSSVTTVQHHQTDRNGLLSGAATGQLTSGFLQAQEQQ